MKFPKLLLRKTIPVVGTDKQGLGNVPVRIARELVRTNHAEILHNHPAVIGLKHMSSRTSSSYRAISMTPLKNLIHTASLFAAKSSRSAILNSLLFKIVDDKLCIMATDLESHFIGSVDGGTTYSFTHDDGIRAVCINAMYLGKILSSQNNNLNLHIVKGKDNPALRIGEFFLDGEDADGFPDMQFLKKEAKIYKSTITDIAAKLTFVGKALSKNTYRSALCGIYFDIKNGQVVGADGNRLHIVSVADTKGMINQKRDDIGIILPASLLRVSKLLTDNIRVIESGEHQYAMFDLKVSGCTHCTGVYKAIEGQYPNYLDVIPQEGFVSKYVVKTKDLMPVLHRAQVAIGNSDDKTMTCDFKNSSLIVSIQRMGRFMYQGVVKGEYHSPSYGGCINVDYLTDAVRTMPWDSIEILLQGKKDAAWTVRNNTGYTSVIMPIGREK